MVSGTVERVVEDEVEVVAGREDVVVGARVVVGLAE
jgi:hypothetical protein